MSNNKGPVLILGGDGYLGWSLGLAIANRTNRQVILADSLIKRRWEKEVNAKLLVPLKKPQARIAAYKRLLGKDNLSFVRLNLLDQSATERVLRRYRPDTIINAAQQPSAPFSMMSPKNSAVTFSNNIVGHLNVLWAIARTDKTATYIKLGTAGCYMDVDTDFVPLGRKDLSFTHEGKRHRVLNSYLPMQATDFYHQSKISDFLIDDLCAMVWGLKIVTVQQSTIFGATIDENHAPERQELAARFNYDAVFSTVLNRFVCQLVIGHPLTVYGDGQQKTGLISLNDTVNNFMRLLNTNVTPGEHMVVHNYTHRHTIQELAATIQAINPNVKVNYLTNPRKESNGRLQRTIELHKAIQPSHTAKEKKLQKELARMIDFTMRYKDNIDPSIILPTVTWDVAEARRHHKHKSFAAMARIGQLLSSKLPVGNETAANEAQTV